MGFEHFHKHGNKRVEQPVGRLRAGVDGRFVDAENSRHARRHQVQAVDKCAQTAVELGEETGDSEQQPGRQKPSNAAA